MATINELIKRYEKLDVRATAEQAFEQTSDLIADLNAEQMFEGRTSEDTPITLDGSTQYAPFTRRVKKEKGQPTDRITLRDTGAFYRGLYAKLEGGVVKISSTDDKADKIEEVTGNKIFGLNESRKKEYSTGALKDKFIELAREVVKNGGFSASRSKKRGN